MKGRRGQEEEETNLRGEVIKERQIVKSQQLESVCVCTLTQSLRDGVYETLAFIFHVLLSFERDGQETIVLSITHIHLHTWKHTHINTHINTHARKVL